MKLSSPRLSLSRWLLLFCCFPVLCQCQPAVRHTRKASPGTKGFRPFKVAKAALTQEKDAYQPRRIALLIGINKYKDPSWHPLRFAMKDAADMARALQHRPNTRFTHLELLTTPQQTTRKAIVAAMKRIKKWNRDPRDTIFVYISAHGTLARDSQHQLRRFLVTHDTLSKQVQKTSLPISELKRQFASLPSQRKVLLLATCHSGAGKSRLTQTMKEELKTLKGSFFVTPMESKSKATIVLGVCSFGETARESPKLKNDIYTHFFIRALRNRYDLNKDGAVTVSEAHDYAKEMTYYHTRGAQRPYAESDILGADPIVLSGKKQRLGRPILFAYNQKFYGVGVEVNGIAKGKFPRGVPVKKGRQHVKLVSHDGRKVLFEGHVDFQQGERMDVRRLFRRQFFSYAIGAKAGYQIFLGGSSAERLSRSLPLFGVEFKLHRPFKIPLDFRFEFAFSRNSHSLSEQDNRPQTVTEMNIGIAATYQWRYQWFTLYLGPRLSAIYLHRQSDLHTDINDFFYSFQPGILLGMEFRMARRWSFFTEGRLNYTYVTTEDGPPRHQGSYEILGGIYFHF